jgi:hypothetical protein
MKMPEYEITIELQNGDWEWWRGEYRDYHDASNQALASAKLRKARLFSIAQIPGPKIVGGAS